MRCVGRRCHQRSWDDPAIAFDPPFRDGSMDGAAPPVDQNPADPSYYMEEEEEMRIIGNQDINSICGQLGLGRGDRRRLARLLANTMQPSAEASGAQPFCPPRAGPCMDMVSAQTMASVRGGSRTNSYKTSAVLAALPAGGTLGVSLVQNGNSVEVLTAAGYWRTVYITDLIVPGLASLDDLQINILVGGINRIELNGGRFARGNANVCTTACGLFVCAGPMETIAITFTNQTAAAIGAGVGFGKVETRFALAGEDGFLCEGSCVVPSVQQTDCASCGGDGEVG